MLSQFSIKPTAESAIVRKRLLLVLVSLAVNLVMGLSLALPEIPADIVDYHKISIFWVMSAAFYAFACGLYFSSWRRSRFLWVFAILFTMPLSIFITFPYIIFKAYRHSWHQIDDEIPR